MNKNLKKIIRRILILVIFLLLIAPTFKIKATDTPIVINGNTITLKDGTICKIGNSYNLKGQEFRGCWCSPLTGDIGSFVSVESYKSQIISVLENMERFNLNTLLLHVRIKNDACYKSNMNPWSSYYSTDPSWDSLPWVIEECHKRGIELHAWMNPYRVSTGTTSNVEALASSFPKNNPASNPDNLLVCSSCVILDPGIPEVQDFLVATCMELVNNYDVDGIHFDDYFYASGCDDTATYKKYNDNNLSIADFRRNNVDKFIENLSSALHRYNKQYNKRVQLGISPTGVYANGSGVVSFDNDGNVSSTGSRTGGYAHYGSPLYADTLNWINHEWIDYIVPQTYHAITNSAVPYCEITTWWNKVMAHTNVNLYPAMGLYMSGGTNNASWSYNDDEAYMQAMYVNGLENAKGMCIYQYSSIKGLTKKEMRGIWDIPVIVPEIKTMDPIIIDDITSLSVERTDFGNILKFPVSDDAKFYVIYRSEKEVTFDPSEVIDIIGDVSNDGIISYPDNYDYESGKIIYYGVRLLSNSNTLTRGVKASSNLDYTNEKALAPEIENIKIPENIIENEDIIITWDTLYYPFGDKMKYEVSYSYDNYGREMTVPVGYLKASRSCNIKIAPEHEKINISIKAYNNLSERIVKFSLDIHKSLGKISNFGTLDSIYLNKEIEFYFNSLADNDTGYLYILEYSTDNVIWNELSRINGTSNYNESIKGIISNVTTTNIYYRIKAIFNDSFAYSNVLSFTVKDYLSDAGTVYVNDEKYNNDKLYFFTEGDKLMIKIKKPNSDNKYSIYYSIDGKNYLKLSTYDPRYSYQEDSSFCTFTININYRASLLMLKIRASNGAKEFESDVMKFYCFVNDLFGEDFLQYLNVIKNNAINDLDLFN